MKTLFFALVATAVSLTVLAYGGPESHAAPAAREAAWVPPVGPPVEVVRGFEPPGERWLAGHRGVDLAAPAGAEVRAASGGVVTYAGLLAGRGVVVVDHGPLRTTYEPVTASVGAGVTVSGGTPIGHLAATAGHCAPAACLHWGVLEGETYLDPMSFLGGGAVRLLPLGPRTITGAPPPPPTEPPGGAALDWPVVPPVVTSPFGMRVHPVTGIHKLHDGTDFRAPCGTPVRAAAAGTVTSAMPRGAYGLRVDLRHGSIRGTALTTGYSHLSRFAVLPGRSVRTGQVIGYSGTTGSSTGCHLHFTVAAASGVSDPMHWLPGSGGAARASAPAWGSRLPPARQVTLRKVGAQAYRE